VSLKSTGECSVSVDTCKREVGDRNGSDLERRTAHMWSGLRRGGLGGKLGGGAEDVAPKRGHPETT
jgi:hypothetical protein